MNEKFFALPQEKQQNIINVGYRVFPQNSYKKSPMSEMADAAGISKRCRVRCGLCAVLQKGSSFLKGQKF